MMQRFAKIRERMLDEKSRIIFDKRLAYAFSGNPSEIWEMLEKINFGHTTKELVEELRNNITKKLVIFGAGYNGIFIRDCLQQFRWHAFLDNKVKDMSSEPIVNDLNSILKKRNSSIPIYNPQHYIEQYGTDESFFVISIPGLLVQQEVTMQLISLGVSADDIFSFSPPNSNIPQYFEVFTPSSKDNIESFIDCGVLDGDTSFDFARWCRGRYSKIWAFEADESNYKNCCANLDKLRDVQLFNLGVWDKEDVLHFHKTNSGFSSIDQNQSYSDNDIVDIKTCKLDDIIKDEKVTFIKMDIEGAELNALQGAAGIISQQKPKLAICIYHKPEDIYEIPEYLLKCNPDYFFRIRHYGSSAYETVLYAETR